MSRVLKSLFVIIAVATILTGATSAYFTDNERSIDNVFAAGTLDLKINGKDSNVPLFNVSNMSADDTQKGTWTLRNDGTLNGYLNIRDNFVLNNENGCNKAEFYDGGDRTCDTPGAGQGELQKVVNLSLFWDTNCDAVKDSGDVSIYNGKAGSILPRYDVNVPIDAKSEKCVSAIFNWPNGGREDNIAQGDTMSFGTSFTLKESLAMPY